MSWIVFAAWFLLALIAMEGVAYLTHRFLMHGPLWFLHRSHHVPHEGGWEWNDLFGIVFAVPSILFIKAGVDAGGSWMLPVGLGMTAYGAIYVVFHDIVVHRRVAIRQVPQWRYLRRIIMAHLIHHKTHGRDGAQSFGFLWAPKALTDRHQAAP